MKTLTSTALAAAALAIATQAAAQVTFYEQQGFQGRSFTTQSQVNDLQRFGFNDRASSVNVTGERWEVCEDVRFRGRCVVLRVGQYPTLTAMGLNDRISSVREVGRDERIDDRRYAPVQATAQITFYEHDGFAGRSFTTDKQVENLQSYGFNDLASSVVVVGDRWEVCENAQFGGRCVVLRPGQYPSLTAMGLNDRVSSVRDVSRNAPAPVALAAPVAAQITFYQQEGFGGRTFTTDKQVENLNRYGFNDLASSVVVVGDRWEVCDDARFNGRCVVLRPGQYPSLAAMGLNDRISSVRDVSRDAHIDDRRYAPAPVAGPDYRRRDNETLYEAPVTSVHAVLGTPERRCWAEREQVAQDQGGANVGGAVVGALLGGILGHQVGGGTGKDVATAGGAVAGALIGSNVGRGTPQPTGQDVQRCEDVPSNAQPQYWDVTYNFRGQEHRVQMTTQPGRTVVVNEQGEPRK